MRLGKASRREAKRDDGGKPVEANMQSNIAGTATVGTFPKLVESEAIREFMEPLLLEDISRTTPSRVCGVFLIAEKKQNIQTEVMINPMPGFFLFFFFLIVFFSSGFCASICWYSVPQSWDVSHLL